MTRLVDLLRWPVLVLVVAGVIAIVYRYGPSRAGGRDSWPAIAASSALAATLWLGGSMLFSWYVSVFGGFIELYGSLAAVMGFLVWIWLSLIAVLLGAELEAAIIAFPAKAQVLATDPRTALCPPKGRSEYA